MQNPRAVRPTARGSGVGLLGEEKIDSPHDSPALAEIEDGLDPDRAIRILDLGPACPKNLAHYSTISRGVRIADLLRGAGIESLRRLDAGEFASTLERAAPAGDTPFDVILTWDLLNYLMDEQPPVLARHLASVACPGAKIHVMVLTSHTIPAEPTRYEILDAGRLIYRQTTEQTTAAPEPPPAKVERWLEPFQVTRSFLLRHGVREFLGVLDDPDSPNHRWF